MSGRARAGAFALVVVVLSLVAACAGLGSWLSAPAGQQPPAQEGATAPVSFALPGGGTLSLPAAPASAEPLKFLVPGLGEVVITPAQKAGTGAVSSGTAGSAAPGGASPPPPSASPPAPTNADAVAQAGGGIVAGITGNGLLGVLAASALAALFGKLGGRRPTPTV